MAKIDTNEWQEFEIGKLFGIVKGTRLTKANMREKNPKYNAHERSV